jgi:NAD-dependent dihydropyrimidine dehydrogenase PreA subunit
LAAVVKRVLLIVWSGTGNTLKVAELIRDSFRGRGYVVDIVDCTGPVESGGNMAAGIDTDSADIIGLGYPIYAFNAPPEFPRYVKALNLRDKAVFIFKSSGEPSFPNNGSSHRLIRLLASCTLLGEYHFLMPYNIVFRFPDNLVKQMYLAAKRWSDILADNIIAGKVSLIKYGLFHRFISWVFSIQGPGGRLNGRLYSVRHDRCTRCLRCILSCPTGNIRMAGGRFRFGWNCAMCMRCSFFCPTDAIRIGLLDSWRVNGPFHFEALEKDETLDGHFITEKTRGLYRIYIPFLGRQD